VKKLATVLLLVVSACHRQTAGISGAPNARVALDMFMSASKAGDLDAMGRIWGSAQGPSIATMDRTTREQREVIMMRCVKHDRYTVLQEATSAGRERTIVVELRYKDLTASTNFIATEGPGGKWYVKDFQLKDLERICVAL
jgi:hypothetical protein